MKLEAVNANASSGVGAFPSKDVSYIFKSIVKNYQYPSICLLFSLLLFKHLSLHCEHR
jgi:hypothetical protein